MPHWAHLNFAYYCVNVTEGGLRPHSKLLLILNFDIRKVATVSISDTGINYNILLQNEHSREISNSILDRFRIPNVQRFTPDDRPEVTTGPVSRDMRGSRNVRCGTARRKNDRTWRLFSPAVCKEVVGYFTIELSRVVRHSRHQIETNFSRGVHSRALGKLLLFSVSPREKERERKRARKIGRKIGIIKSDVHLHPVRRGVARVCLSGVHRSAKNGKQIIDALYFSRGICFNFAFNRLKGFSDVILFNSAW